MTRDRIALCVVALAGLLGLVIALQGWQARGPDEDVVGSMVRTAALVERGIIPQRSTLTDLNAFRPPGTSWLALPGVLLFSDPRLVELTGSAALYLGSLVGVFVLARFYFGVAVAVLATVLYAGSAIPLNLASQLWPRGHPFFCVWMVYCAGQWIDRRDGRWLAAACLLWMAGMYVHLEMAPALLVLPVLWWVYRPPVNVRWLAAAAVITLVVWSPYLAFERERAYIDLQSQLSLRPLDSRGGELVALCGDTPQPSPALAAAVTAGSAAARVAAIADLALVTFETRVLGGEFILLALLGGALITAGGFGRQRFRLPALVTASGSGVIIAGLVVTSLLVTEFALRWIAAPASPLAGVLLNARRIHVWLFLLAGVGLVLDGRAERLASDLRHTWRRGDQARVLAIAVVVPWTILLLLTDAQANRMLGIWPLQVTLIAAFVGAWSARRPAAWFQRWALVAVVTSVVVANVVVLGRTRDWVAHGWAGRPPDRIEASDFRHVRCEDEGITILERWKVSAE